MPDLVIDKNDIHFHWSKVLEATHWTEGAYLRKFEDEVSAWSGKHAVAFNSAGSGLFAIMRCLPGPREDALVQDNTFFATGAMVKEAGYRPILVDAKKDDFSMSALAATEFMSPSVRAVVLTHVGGHLANDYMALSSLCAANNIPLIEDAAHVFGVGDGNRNTCAGSFGYAAVFSLYPTKAIPVGEGGVVVTHDAEFAEELRRFRNYGKFTDADGVLKYQGYGFNLRMDEFTAVMAYLQMKARKNILDARAEAAYKLSQIVPTLYKRTSPTNWYKYIAPAGFPAVKQAGKVYASSDQLHSSLTGTTDLFLPVSKWIAESHICLPVEPALYAKKTVNQITDYLMRP